MTDERAGPWMKLEALAALERVAELRARERRLFALQIAASHIASCPVARQCASGK